MKKFLSLTLCLVLALTVLLCAVGCTKTGGKEGAYTREGDYVYIGEYPQTVKASDVTITSTTDDRGYYLGSDGSYYAKVTATPCEEGYKFSNGEAVVAGQEYFFKVEPIRWRILKEADGNATLLCDSIIASISYQSDYTHGTNFNYYTTANGAPEGTFANNYKYSNARAWLNSTFLNDAFSAFQRESVILTSEVDNSLASTGEVKNGYVCENTSDKVFFLSLSEVNDSKNGLGSSASNYDESRKMMTSDYSRATGAWMDTTDTYYGNGSWWLRSPDSLYGDMVRLLHFGNAENLSRAANTNAGAVPAMKITLD